MRNQSNKTNINLCCSAGSRYETVDNFGASHFLRIVAGLGTKGESHFSITRNIQQLGANLTCQVGREHVAYTLEGTNDTM